MSKMRIQSPKIDKRQYSEILDKLKRLVPYYTPEWQGLDDADAGTALLKIFSYLVSQVIGRLNRVPYKHFVAFLDMLGIKLLPAQPSRVPLSFTLSEGTDLEVLVPERTQAAAGATDEHEELPFETEKTLLAIPSLLKKVISIDPREDTIYIPPPKFLEVDLEGQGSLTYSYTLVSLAAKDSKLIQLDHVTELEKEDFLKIGSGDKTEYVIIADISGTIVKIEDRLSQAFPVGTVVEKLVDFALFQGKNMQEHSLYLGHPDLFNIKTQADFILDISHHTGAGAKGGVTPLDYTWEYWGEKESEEEEEKEEDWYPLNINPDNTNGLSKSETITLEKREEGEIKEKEINGLKSRWIRCRLNQGLPVHEARTLPLLDTVKFSVQSFGNDLFPELVFNNETPLDMSQAFYPLGTEPRIYDKFYIGSKEIFSKKGAKVTLNFQAETRGITGPPAAILMDEQGNTFIRVFTRGTYGRLMELKIEIDNYSFEKMGTEWEDHGFPPGGIVAADCTPGVARGDTPKIFVFIRTEDGKLVERFFNGAQWQWLEHGTPSDDITLKFDPAAIYLYDYKTKENRITVFIAGSDGNIHEFFRDSDSEDNAGDWITHEKPNDDVSIDSSPYAENYDKVTDDNVNLNNLNFNISFSNRVKVFFKGENGNLYELDCKPADKEKYKEEDHWKTNYGHPGSVSVKSSPFAKIYWEEVFMGDIMKKNYYAKVFVKGDDDQLWEFDTKNPGDPTSWKSLGIPDKDENIEVDSKPHGIIKLRNGVPQEVHIFIKGSDNCLWEWDGTEWKSYFSPPQAKLDFFPVVPIYYSVLSAFSASSENSIIERDFNQSNWNEYKDPNEATLTPTLSWEYWNGKGWLVLEEIEDDTANLLKRGEISFTLPKDIEEIEIAGQKNYWIQARIVGGDYGKETFSILTEKETEETAEHQLTSTKDSIRPPVIKKEGLTISYNLKTQKFPQQCLTYNNLRYLDCTEECKTTGKHFSPFLKPQEKTKTLFLGFEKFFKGGPIRVFFDAQELDYTEEQKPKLTWKYSRKEDWKEITGNDFTEAFIKADILEFLGKKDFSGQSIFGDYLYWLKAGLVNGEYEEMPRLKGIYPNTTWAYQAETLRDEILGSSDGTAGQTFSFFKFPVRQGEEVRVKEILIEEEKQNLLDSGNENAITEVKDDQGNVIETWVLWTEVSDFYESGDEDRHYTLDRATGAICFGDGEKGMIPPKGENNIKAFVYQSGGGSAGNVGIGEINALKSGTPNVDSVINPAVADGGADTATLEQMLEIAPALISHRNRAVNPQDFEWLAKQASRKVVKARCLPNTNNKKQKEVGWVTVVIVPDSLDAQPNPSLQLRRIVKKHLENHSAANLSPEQHICVIGPDYSTVGVSVQIDVVSLDAATEVERTAREKLDAFFHPLGGGPEEKGWDFGRNVSASDVYALLENIDGVDHVEKLEFILDQETLKQDILEIKEDTLVSNGEHLIDIHFQVKQGG